MPSLSPELYFTALTASFTALIWMPIIVNRLLEMGLWTALKNPQPDVRAHSEWAYRLTNAHRNAIENLVVFAPLAIIVQVLGVNNETTATAASVFFFAEIRPCRNLYLGHPFFRTLAFLAGFGCQMAMALRIFGII